MRNRAPSTPSRSSSPTPASFRIPSSSNVPPAAGRTPPAAQAPGCSSASASRFMVSGQSRAASRNCSRLFACVMSPCSSHRRRGHSHRLRRRPWGGRSCRQHPARQSRDAQVLRPRPASPEWRAGRSFIISSSGTVDQRALIAALRSGHLSAAYLDVTDPEPLPPEHLLWTAPNCFITPHTAGGFGGEEAALVRHFLENLARFTAGTPLADWVM